MESIMELILLTLFVLSLYLCIHAYFIYPLTLWVAGLLKPFKAKKADITPSISILIAAYNEEKNIGVKLKNTLASDYPENKMEIHVGSDGSTDKTVEIAARYANQGVRVHDFRTNRGKTAVQNDLAKRASGEILVFTDAASFIGKGTLKELVKAFADPRVGCIAGRMAFVNTNANLTTESQGLYWKYEMCMRALESRTGSLIGVDGPLYAVRGECYVQLAENIISDLLTPLLVSVQGKRVVIEMKALILEEPTDRSTQELKTRRRITTRGLVGFKAHAKELFSKKNPFLAFQIVSHKLLRWFVGPLVLLNLLVSIMMSDQVTFFLMLCLHILFYSSAYIGWFYEKRGKHLSYLKIPYYFCLVNLAAMLGIYDFLRGKQAVSWKPVRTDKANK